MKGLFGAINGSMSAGLAATIVDYLRVVLIEHAHTGLQALEETLAETRSY